MPELDPLGTMTSTSTTQSPNVCSVYISLPSEAVLTSSLPFGSNVSLPLSSTPAVPTAHLFLALLRSFHPARSLPLKGVTALSPDSAALLRPRRKVNVTQMIRRMGSAPDKSVWQRFPIVY